MKKNYITLLFLSTITFISAQTETITIDWSFGSNPSATGNANTNRTIEVGDTVVWNWYANGTHNVKSDNTATESFESQFFTTGGSFSYTFTTEGTNDYFCVPHSGNMFGTITVVAEGTLSIDTFNLSKSLKMYPNPADSKINFSFDFQSQDELDVQIFNLLGKKVVAQKITQKQSEIIVSNLNKGIYIVQIRSKNSERFFTKRFVKL